MNITQRPSPNFNDRREALDMLVLHYTGMETGAAAIERLCDEEAQVSAHYVVEEDGQIFQLVADNKRAWHAGVSSWAGQTDLNSRSIGIEIVNGGHNVPLEDGSLPPFPKVQIDAVIALSNSIITRHNIPQTRIVGHSDIAPGRKLDPGEHFPWERLAAAGIGLFPTASNAENESLQLMGHGLTVGTRGAAVQRLQEMLKTIGYNPSASDTYDKELADIVEAFQRRWVPDQVTGASDLRTLKAISIVADLYQNARN